MFCKILGLITCKGGGIKKRPILTSCGSAHGFVSLERRLEEEIEVGRVFVKEGVQVPGDNVVLIEGVAYDMRRAMV